MEPSNKAQVLMTTRVSWLENDSFIEARCKFCSNYVKLNITKSDAGWLLVMSPHVNGDRPCFDQPIPIAKVSVI